MDSEQLVRVVFVLLQTETNKEVFDISAKGTNF